MPEPLTDEGAGRAALQIVVSPDDFNGARAALAARAKGTRHPATGTIARKAVAPQAPQPVVLQPPPGQTRLPIGAAAAGSGVGVGAPPIAAVGSLLALALAMILLASFSLDLAAWRSTLLAFRLEHPD
jgi:hypothetical protein